MPGPLQTIYANLIVDTVNDRASAKSQTHCAALCTPPPTPQGSTWRHLEKLGVEYIYSTLFCDWDTLGPSSPVMDPSFCGPAIYSFDVKGE
jgi:hypothetical protein